MFQLAALIILSLAVILCITCTQCQRACRG